MKYSKWRADRGGYDVFEDKGGQSIDLGNDLPTPNLSQSSPIGVSSVDAGRKSSGRLVKIGTSQFPQGSVLATKGSDLGSILSEVPGGSGGVVMMLLGLGLGWLVGRRI